MKATFTYNEKPVFQLYVPDDTPFYFLSMSQTNLGVHDIIMDKTLTIGLLKQLHGAEHVLNSISTAMETQTTGKHCTQFICVMKTKLKAIRK